MLHEEVLKTKSKRFNLPPLLHLLQLKVLSPLQTANCPHDDPDDGKGANGGKDDQRPGEDVEEEDAAGETALRVVVQRPDRLVAAAERTGTGSSTTSSPLEANDVAAEAGGALGVGGAGHHWAGEVVGGGPILDHHFGAEAADAGKRGKVADRVRRTVGVGGAVWVWW